ncbi:MAG: hypothetical protein M0P57_09965 [Syntrophales bacterium]|nr:hypothetical protein [Syntrophales bacterium]
MYFSPEQISTISWSFGQAEKLAERYFDLGWGGFKSLKYDVKTRFNLEDHEINDRAFAHLCRYFYQKNNDAGHPDNFYFFKVCLQDNRILNAVERSSSFIKLAPLMLYIAMHELVHVVRFNGGEIDFDAPLDEKVIEEEKVHSITRSILHPIATTEMKLVIDCFNDRLHIGDIFSEEERSELVN